jgi:hypothetical protein
MLLTDQTRLQIKIGVWGSDHLPPEYQSFFAKWMAFNTAYDELAKGKEKQKVLKVADQLQNRWPEISPAAKLLVSLECVGGKKIPNAWMLAPDLEVKSATLYLREALGITARSDPPICQLETCRSEKQAACNMIPVSRSSVDMWAGHELGALMRIVYQVRCNLIHGEKMLCGEGFQANRDRELVRLSDGIVDQILNCLIELVEPNPK